MHTSRIEGHASDHLAAFSLRGETRGSPLPEHLLELTPVRSLQDSVIALGGSRGGTRPSPWVGRPRGEIRACVRGHTLLRAHRGLDDRQRLPLQRLYAAAEGLGIDHDADRGDQRRRDRDPVAVRRLDEARGRPRSGLFAPVFPRWRIGPFAIAQPVAAEPDVWREVPGRGCDQNLLSSGGGAGFTVPMARLGSRRGPRLVLGSPRWNTRSDARRATPRRPEQTSTASLQEEA
jgi:hypothetical protein